MIKLFTVGNFVVAIVHGSFLGDYKLFIELYQEETFLNEIVVKLVLQFSY